MTTLPARLAWLLSLSITAAAGSLTLVAPAVAQDDATDTAAATDAKPGKELRSAVDDFWHFGKIARYDLAAAAGQKILDLEPAGPDLLATFEAVARDRGDNLDQWLLRWQGVDAMREVTSKVSAAVNEGRLAVRSDPNAIEGHIQQLGAGERGYLLAVDRLRESGELPVPLMIDYLRDPARRALHVPIRRALRDLGQQVLSPLVVATAMGDNDTLIGIIDVLADIGYDAPVPYLAKLAKSTDAAASVRAAATAALARMGATPGSASDEFYDYAERLYYDRSAVDVDEGGATAHVWSWSDDRGLTKRDVAAAIFHEILAKRAAAESLKLGAGSRDPLSLWIAADFRREAQLPEGATDPTLPENSPPPAFYATQAGARYVYAALDRAQRDGDPAVAIRAVRALQEIVGPSTLGAEVSQPLLDALRNADRRVRFEAAFALAGAMPTQSFGGQERVVPLLAESMAQTGTPTVAVVHTNQDDVNRLVTGLQGAGYAAAGGTNAAAAISDSRRLPSVEVILISEDLPAAEIDRVFALSAAEPRLERAAKVIMARTQASPYASRMSTDPLVSLTQATEADGLKGAIDAARERAGALPLDPQVATEYALRAARLLQTLALSSSPVFNVADAEVTLFASLDDARPEVVKAAGDVLSLLNRPQVQPTVLAKANDERVADDVRVSLYNSLADNARRFGNGLTGEQLDALRAAVSGTTSVEVRTAAAEARGALNLPPDEAKKLILESQQM